jgi:anti-sigma regulatory factor (Ser/Thr protein kinase)
MENQREKISFLESYSPSTRVIPQVIDQLILDLKDARYDIGDYEEIILAMDEAVTNAVQATSELTDRNIEEQENQNITIRYTITDNEFDATIIDHGKGLDIFHILHALPDTASTNYHNEIITYATEKEKQRITIRVNGEEITPGGIGAGLKIIMSFMDSVEIDLIDREKVISHDISQNTDGTILNMKRKRRH